MAADFNYNRPKVAVINDTPINMSYEQRESDGVRAAIAAGTTGIAELVMLADADETGGADVQDIFRFVVTPVLNANTGKFEVDVTATPVLGDATDGAPVTKRFTHDELMDVWQSAAGRARQA